MANFTSNQYDVVVCGAGPAGLMAACTLGRSTSGARRILILDKKEPWKEPIYCAEAVSRDRLKALWPVDESFVRGPLSGIYFTSPKHYRAEFYSKNCGLILNRAQFHRTISDSCVKSGVECHYDVVIRKLERDGNGWKLTVETGGETVVLNSTVVVDASGPSCKLTRGIECLQGIETGDVDLEPGIFAVAEGIEHSKEHIELFFGSEFEAGYGWIFPRDGKEVNIGFVLGKGVDHKVPMRQKLLDFIARDYPQAKVKAIYGGTIACTGTEPKPLAKCGLFKAGDAASCVNPISRSGIVEALLCGKIVAESVKDWLEDSGANRDSIENRVLDRWMEALGKKNCQVARAKAGFNRISDAQFDRAALKLSKLPREKQTLLRIFFTVLWACPSLIWKMRSFLR